MRSEPNKMRIEERLRNWNVELPQDSRLAERVLNEISVRNMQDHYDSMGQGVAGLLRTSRRGFWALASVSVAVVMVCITVLVREHNLSQERSFRQAQNYFLLIHPMAHAEAIAEERDPSQKQQPPSTIDMLAWMRSRLDLSSEQFATLVQLHESYQGRFIRLYQDLCEIDARYQGFEKQRLNDDPIDFMALYQLLRDRDALNDSSEQTSGEYLSLVLQVLTPEQAHDYLSLLGRSGFVPPPTSSTPILSSDDAGA